VVALPARLARGAQRVQGLPHRRSGEPQAQGVGGIEPEIQGHASILPEAFPHRGDDRNARGVTGYRSVLRSGEFRAVLAAHVCSMLSVIVADVALSVPEPR
jgi:hypothetical protein